MFDLIVTIVFFSLVYLVGRAVIRAVPDSVVKTAFHLGWTVGFVFSLVMAVYVTL